MRRAGTTFPGGLFQRTGVEGGLRIRRYLPEAVIVLGALYCAGLPIYGVTTISFTSALYIALAVVLALALMLPRPARTHLALVLASFGTALLLAEVYFSATDRSTLEISLNSALEIRLNSAREAGRTVDLRSRVAIVRDLRAQGVDAMPAVPESGQLVVSGPAGRVLPVLAGVSMATTVHCNESGNTPSTMPTNTGSTIRVDCMDKRHCRLRFLATRSLTVLACRARHRSPVVSAPHFRPRSISVLIARGHSTNWRFSKNTPLPCSRNSSSGTGSRATICVTCAGTSTGYRFALT